MAAPTGRAAKPTKNVANDARVPAVGLKLGKNAGPKTTAAVVPYRKKSYHSMVVPMTLATAALLTWVRCPLSTSSTKPSCYRAIELVKSLLNAILAWSRISPPLSAL
jgi:hypothetical protein